MPFTLGKFISETQTRLAGLANAFTNQQLISFINEGKDAFWTALVTSADDYFIQQTTGTTGQVNTFLPLSTTVREYTLPSDCLAPRFIEVTSSGFEDVRFVYRKITHPDFQQQRRDATANGPATGSNFSIYYYTIVGKETFMLAAYPEQALTLSIWYVRSLPDLVNLGDSIDETVLPFPRVICDYVVRKIELIKDPATFAAWKDEWRTNLMLMIEGASPRDETNGVFVSDFDDTGSF
jgi:hypothetical protein